MKQRGLYVALALALLLGGGVWWSLQEEEKAASKGGKDQPAADGSLTKLLDIPASQFNIIELRKLGQPPITLQRGTGDNWRITAPVEYRADGQTITTIITSLASLVADKTVDEKPKTLDEYGLGIPAIDVTIRRKDGKTHRVLVGDQSSMSGSFYAKVDNDPKVYAIGTFVQAGLNKSLADLRDKRLLTFEPNDITQISLTAKGATTEVARTGQGKWQMTKPKPYRADVLTWEEMVAKLGEAKQDLTLAPEEAAKLVSAFATGTPVATVSVRTPAGTQSMEVRKAKDDYLARATSAEGVHKISKEVATGLDKSLDQLRTNKLFDFGFAEVSQAGYREGSTNLTFTHEKDEWKSGGVKMSGVSVQSYIDKLRDLASLRFLDSGMPAETVELTLTSNKGAERVTLGKQGTQWFAQRPGDPAVYEIDPKIVEELQSAARGVKPDAPEKKK
ncbi:MAG: DUF4340 domain-containing protein [Bryobacteraceae bacterium]|nr:DUF4340 domain-containing protein [Bryobacteraceae bacterium]